MRTPSIPSSPVGAGIAGALMLTAASVPAAHAQTDPSPWPLSSVGTPATKAAATPWVPEEPPSKHASDPVRLSNGVTVQIMDDVLGPYSAHTGFRSGDLGAMAPINNDGEFAMIFGDSFRGDFGDGWMSPVGVVASMSDDGFLTVDRPIDGTSQVNSMMSYDRVNSKTLIPSDVINIDGVLYMHGTWHEPFGTVTSAQVWRSYDQGKTWKAIGRIPGNDHNGMTQLLSWDKGPDGYVYAVSTKFGRDSPVYMFRFKPEHIATPGNWESYSSQGWGTDAEPILAEKVKAGELNLRYIDGHWVLVMFNLATEAVEVRISDKLETDWEQVSVATIAKNGPWADPQTPMNWSQPYGGYIVPGSHLDNMDVVISQWNTGDNSRYMSTQFNVKGLDELYDIDVDQVRQDIEVTVLDPETAQRLAAEDAASETNTAGGAAGGAAGGLASALAFVVSALAVLGAVGLAALPLFRDMLPPQIQALLP
ncbi:DUF4185 domain-containing protein [Corynebacterium mucifaciens]|uniref:DUF4185 domain-containing protein n=1 Tax=Corynebacterium mucifaciens TaxID=57171 RepID=A0A7X6LPJ1_9CORY|nr:DUF4185 domain-containing protein [Corynebacterium mucifaciens]NKY67984.1 DUF4185 domain-containing protein [Corynebacterium mucifaciens]